MIRRLSTHSLALRIAPHLDAPAKFLDTLNRPQLRDILETIDTHEASLYFILGPVQFFKTLVGQLYLLRCHLLRPRKLGWYSPTKEFAEETADGKLNQLLDRYPDLAPLQFDTGTRGAYDKTKLTKLRRQYVGGAEHRLLSANNENDRTGKTFQDVLIDEPHRYDPGSLEQIFNRVKDYEDTATKLLMSTGMTRGTDLKGGEAALIWDQTDQRLWHSRCPHCKKYFEPRYVHYAEENEIPIPNHPPSIPALSLGNNLGDKDHGSRVPQQTAGGQEIHPARPVRESTGVQGLTSAGKRIIGGLLYERRFLPTGLPDEAAIAATLRYKCPHCPAEYPDTPGSRHALNGDYQRPTGIYVCQNAHAKRAHHGWTFSAIAGRAWLPIVMDWEHAQLARQRGDLEPLGKVVREHFGSVWNPVDYLKATRLRPPGGYRMADLNTWGRQAAAA